jgi:hypothetical protein
MANALDDLKSLRGPSLLRKEARAGGGRRPPVFNSHVHLPPNFSAFTTVAQAVELAGAQGCALLGTSNYYDFAAYSEFAARCRTAAIFPLFGLEIMCRDEAMAQAGTRVNDPGTPGKIYFCGKGLARFDPPSPRAAAILGDLRARDSGRIAEMVRRCCAALAERGVRIDVTCEGIVDALVRRHGSPRETVVLQERHVALALQEALFAAVPAAERLARLPALLGGPCKLRDAEDAVGVQNEVRNHLMKAGKPGFVPESYIDVARAMALILELGGVPCYPVLADGANPMGQFEARPADLVASLGKVGIWAAEFIPNRNAPALLVDYVKTLRAAGVVVVAGTEHNTLDLLPIMPSAKGAPVPAELLPVLWEGACVMAAHQYLVAHGETGYVTPEGTLHPAYPDAEARIADFAALGEAVVAEFRKR